MAIGTSVFGVVQKLGLGHLFDRTLDIRGAGSGSRGTVSRDSNGSHPAEGEPKRFLCSLPPRFHPFPGSPGNQEVEVDDRFSLVWRTWTMN